MNYSLQMNKTNIIGPLPVAQPGKPMQPSAHSATSRMKWAVALRAQKPLPLGEAFGYTSTPFYHTFPLATRLNGRKTAKTGRKVEKMRGNHSAAAPQRQKTLGKKRQNLQKYHYSLDVV